MPTKRKIGEIVGRLVRSDPSRLENEVRTFLYQSFWRGEIPAFVEGKGELSTPSDHVQFLNLLLFNGLVEEDDSEQFDLLLERFPALSRLANPCPAGRTEEDYQQAIAELGRFPSTEYSAAASKRMDELEIDGRDLACLLKNIGEPLPEFLRGFKEPFGIDDTTLEILSKPSDILKSPAISNDEAALGNAALKNRPIRAVESSDDPTSANGLLDIEKSRTQARHKETKGKAAPLKRGRKKGSGTIDDSARLAEMAKLVLIGHTPNGAATEIAMREATDANGIVSEKALERIRRRLTSKWTPSESTETK